MIDPCVMLPKPERLRLLSGFVAKKSTGITEFHGFSYSRDDPSKPNLTLMVLALPHSYCVWLKIKKTPKKSGSSKTIPTTSHNQHHLNLNPICFPISIAALQGNSLICWIAPAIRMVPYHRHGE